MIFSDDYILFQGKYAEMARQIYCHGFAIMPNPGRSFDNLCKGTDLEVLFAYEVNTARLLGFLLFRVVADQAEIFTLVIAQNARKQGVGGALLKKFLARVQSRVETIFLEVAADNTRAISLYQSVGFAQIGIRKYYYQYQNGQRADAKVFSFSVPK